jgi:hypothetical protein
MQNHVDPPMFRIQSIGNPVMTFPCPISLDFIQPEDLKVSDKVHVTVNPAASCIDFKVILSYMLERETVFIGELTNRFEVKDLSSYIDEGESEDEFQIDVDFIPMLLGIAFANTRGYFAAELKNTPLAPFPFPMVALEHVQKRTTYELVK